MGAGSRWLGLILSLPLLLVARGAGATAIVLSTSGDMSSGGTLEIDVGLDDVSRIQAYTLDVVWDPTELSLTGASPLASTEIATGFFAAKAFTLDPTATSCGTACARASVLTVPPDVLYLDGRTNFPSADPRLGLFALDFLVLSVVDDGQPDVTVGLLDVRADSVDPIAGDPAIDLMPASTSISLPVPEPPGALLVVLVAPALGLAARARRQGGATGSR